MDAARAQATQLESNARSTASAREHSLLSTTTVQDGSSTERMWASAMHTRPRHRRTWMDTREGSAGGLHRAGSRMQGSQQPGSPRAQNVVFGSSFGLVCVRGMCTSLGYMARPERQRERSAKGAAAGPPDRRRLSFVRGRPMRGIRDTNFTVPLYLYLGVRGREW